MNTDDELRATVLALRVQVEHLQAENARLQTALTQAQQRLAELEGVNQQLQVKLNTLKQAPFQARRRRKAATAPAGAAAPKRPGRPQGHEGSGRPRPTRIDRTALIPVGDVCPNCGHPLSGPGVMRQRVVEDIEPVRPTQVTAY